MPNKNNPGIIGNILGIIIVYINATNAETIKYWKILNKLRTVARQLVSQATPFLREGSGA